ncbi:MAG: ATP-dependent Clp protease adaptor ClpS [Nitrospinae bacterium]|nr:ATP-dependent Clp protease adaptor ClpS [Nitrospinota bacterium]
MAPRKTELDTDTIHETQSRERFAPMYWVVMHNDPVTTMDFVVEILMKVFSLSFHVAEDLMYRIHYTGLARIGLMPLERAEFKVETVHRAARASGYPLTCTIEPEDV